jgi:hypothetical protein
VIIRRNCESGVLQMAQAIAHRHARIGAIGRPVPFVLRHVRPFSINHFHVARPCSFTPRLSFQINTHRSPPVIVRPITEGAPGRLQKFVGGISERYVRVPSVIEPGLAPTRVARAPERLLAKPIVAVSATPALPKETSAAPSAVAAMRSAAAPIPDVNRLANEVLQVIDKRVIAYRERAGRR